MFPAFSASLSPTHSIGAALLGLALLVLAPASMAADAKAASQPSATADTTSSYKEVSLKDLVDKSRTEIPGQRIIFAPSAVTFRARLSAMPSPQKADYLMSAMAMMKVSSPPKVSQRIGIDYGGEKGLAAYIDDAVVERLAKTAKVGQTLTFYAFHVYNNNRGPALVITSFQE